MIAIGSNIGTGLFIGTGAALKAGGPAAVVIAFLVITFALYFMMASLTEIGIHYPVTGSFASYATRFVDPVCFPSSLYMHVHLGKRLTQYRPSASPSDGNTGVVGLPSSPSKRQHSASFSPTGAIRFPLPGPLRSSAASPASSTSYPCASSEKQSSTRLA